MKYLIYHGKFNITIYFKILKYITRKHERIITTAMLLIGNEYCICNIFSSIKHEK